MIEWMQVEGTLLVLMSRHGFQLLLLLLLLLLVVSGGSRGGCFRLLILVDDFVDGGRQTRDDFLFDRLSERLEVALRSRGDGCWSR